MARNFSPWAYWRLRLDATPPSASLPSALDALERHREATRAALDARLGPWPEAVPLAVETRDEEQCDGYRRVGIVFDSEAGMSVPAHLLVPDDRRAPGPAVLAIHGHGLDKDLVCGIDRGDPAARFAIDDNNGDYARQLARRGFVVLAPDLRTFGERADHLLPVPPIADEVDDIVQHHFVCDYELVCAAMFGEQPVTHQVWDLRRALDVLSEHPLVDPHRLGVAGWSFGGMLALVLAAIDERVRASVVSCFFSSWRRAHELPWNMCGNQVVAGVLGALEHTDIAALVAPRVLCIESATDDDLFPVDAARAGVAQLRDAYSTLDASADAIVHDVFAGSHGWHGTVAIDVLERAL
ncbi:MAG TPA: acetylxylan esterase [Acidimicrobiia bacterium]|nr:acetylxylan esterase [Acidimicrobiia bacterium]